MTIEVRGHVASITFVGANEHEVTLHLESSRLAAHPHAVSIRAKPAEIEMYKAGMPVIVLVRPA